MNVITKTRYYPDQLFDYENRWFKVVRCLQMLKPSKLYMVTLKEIEHDEEGNNFNSDDIPF